MAHDHKGRGSPNLIGHHSGRRIAAGTRDALDVTVLMDGLTVFVGRQIDREIDWLGANFAGYFWEWVTTHDASFGRSQVT
jgi:hypothetical protein